MAFVFKAEKPSFPTSNGDFPGPGQYDADQKQEVEPNFVSFLTGEKRKMMSSANPTNNPGPGSYNLPVSIQGYNAKTKAFTSTLNPGMETLEERQQSTVFKSAAKRSTFEHETEVPGPGWYFRQTGERTVQENNTANFKKPVTKGIDAGTVPSIPSFIHAYGYTEVGNKALRLNRNPLLEVQKFVGPGYYDVEQPHDPVKSKGIAWDKPHAERNNSFGLMIGTGNNVGPGSYKIKSRGIFPLYKLKPSAGFASKSGRSMFNNKKKNPVKKTRNLMEEQAQEIEELGEFAPGPGYYHNTSTASSFNQSQSQKSSSLQFFGSGAERFGDTFSTTTNMGPGKYNTSKDIAKKFQKNPNMQIPFVTAVKRFNEKLEEVPGPGEYEVRTNLANETTHIGPKGPVESFGVTESRFKPTNTEEVPGPGAYHKKDSKAKEGTEALAKSSHMFSSTSKREAIKPTGVNVPPPGSYDVNNFNLATKVTKPEYDDPDLSPKKPPFNTATERFKNHAARIDEEDGDDGSFDDDWTGDGHTRGDLILKVRNQPKPTVAFTSQTKRVGVPVAKEKTFIPGPGKYYGPNQEDWIKKTYNVNFTTD